MIIYGGNGVFTGDRDLLNYFKDTVINFIKKKKIPFFMIPGNHEKTQEAPSTTTKILSAID